ncbi:PHP domain-containing protein [Ktedonosporobacter rubrisoli]|uniref:PHP domain-containing protein n=1 Tax=Ktedonosporobacter rubrisoli TaxID=2509675 RepID=A0A4P6K006_KTERU|nr:PHP domain-containing protein [Ktedonosporobacter rubrisoli]QBD80726.1 PHP domain-containing protein [Ktedonosporobacter rubrisoli]
MSANLWYDYRREIIGLPVFAKEYSLTHLIKDLTLSPDSSIDLHMHTTYSDGRQTAAQLVDYLVDQGFDMVAVTDHDRVDMVDSIQTLADEKGLPVLPGVEMSTQWNGKMGDLLCYGFDPVNNYLRPLTEKIVSLQLENTREVHSNLLKQGYQFPRQAELLAHKDGKVRIPTDIFLLLLEHGIASDRATIDQIINKAGYRPFKADMAETVDAAHRSGALCLIAHPGRRQAGFTFYDPALLDQLRADVPIDGIELIHPMHSKEMIEAYQEYIRKHDLLCSTGSDSHGHAKRMPIKHRAAISRRLLERLGIKLV